MMDMGTSTAAECSSSTADNEYRGRRIDDEMTCNVDDVDDGSRSAQRIADRHHIIIADGSRSRMMAHRTQQNSWLRQLARMILIGVVSSPAVVLGDITLLVSQGGLDQIASFTTTTMNRVIDETPVQLAVRTAEQSQFGTLGTLDMANLVDVGDVKLKLINDRLNVLLTNFTLYSESNITASIWPLPASEETIIVDMHIVNATIGVRVHDRTRLQMAQCTFEAPVVKSRTKNYWLYSQGAKAGSYYVGKNFHTYACPTIAAIVDDVNKMMNRSIPLVNLIADKHALPFGLADMTLHYHVTDMQMRDSILAVGMAVEWLSPEATDADWTAAYLSGREHDVSLEIANNGGHELTVWLHESIANDLLAAMRWDFMLLNQSVPVTSEMIPARSRRFLTTMCRECYFLLKVYGDSVPRVHAVNESVVFSVEERVIMDMVNPKEGTSTVFMEFSLGIEGSIEPRIVDGRVFVGVNLVDARINITNSAFPPEWSDFVNELVEGMITGMIWPQIKTGIERSTLEEGIPLSNHCGIDPTSAKIVIARQRIGVSVDLQLDNFQLLQCLRDAEAAAPDIDPETLG